MSRSAPRQQHRHPVNRRFYEDAGFGDRLADRIASAIGSWRFLIIQSVLVTLWVGLNLIGFLFRWDPYPFILLNLMFSVQAAYTGPVLLLAGNRQSQKDRLTLEQTYDDSERLLKEIRRNTEITVEILERLKDVPAPAGEGPPARPLSPS